MSIVDIESKRIERDIGDEWGRTPHLVTDDEGADGYVLYVPTSDGMWAAAAFSSIAPAVAYVEKLVAKKTQTEKKGSS
jgi:hypothetical protein